MEAVTELFFGHAADLVWLEAGRQLTCRRRTGRATRRGTRCWRGCTARGRSATTGAWRALVVATTAGDAAHDGEGKSGHSDATKGAPARQDPIGPVVLPHGCLLF